MEGNLQHQVMALEGASDSELRALLGMYALTVVQDPAYTLQEARSGAFITDGSAALGEEFKHGEFERIARIFLRKWGGELRKALCGNEKLYREVKAKGVSQLDVVVGLIVGAISQAVPGLAALTGLLTVLGLLVARSGLHAFCQTLAEIQAEK